MTPTTPRTRCGSLMLAGAILAGALLATRANAHAQATAEHMHSTSTAQPDARVMTLLTATQNAADIFRNRTAAIAAGYRPVGPDIPFMGEHWINPRLVWIDTVVVTRPALLTYIRVNGKPVLTGVVFAVPLAPGMSPPRIFGDGGLWHEHNGTIDEEAMLPDHNTAPTAATGTRLALLHAWLWSANPNGVFATENLTLPFLRLGLKPPATFDESSARALSVAAGAREFYINLAHAPEDTEVGAALLECEKTALQIVSQADINGLSNAALDELARAWVAAIKRIAATAGADAARRINGGRLP